jgi:hypothetical protein
MTEPFAGDESPWTLGVRREGRLERPDPRLQAVVVVPARDEAERVGAQRGLAHDLTLASWRARNSFQATQFPLERLLEAKRESIAVVLPAREVAATIEPIARCVAELGAAGLIDEAVVVDAAS